jgi:hypothetical protein
MDAKADRTGYSGKPWIYVAVAGLLILVTAFSIRWPSKDKLLGDTYEARVYANTSFRLLSVNGGAGRTTITYNYDNRFNDSFVFEFEEESDSYLIYRVVPNGRLYLCSDDDNSLYVSEEPQGDGSRWKVIRHDNTMYYFIVNEQSGLALTETADSVATLSALDESDVNMYMRLQ